MVKLYGGLKIDDKWYNYCKVESLDGGAIALVDGVDKSGAARLMNLIKSTVKFLYTENGDEYELKENDYHKLPYADAWKIALQYIEDFSEDGTFTEHHFCNVCSSPGQERYTQVNENWNQLIKDGFIDEHYLIEPVFTWDVELEDGFEIKATGEFKGGLFHKVTMGHLTMGDMLKVSNLPDLKMNESVMVSGLIDSQLKSIDGMNQKDFNVYVKRSLRDSFSKKYIKSMKDQSLLLDGMPIGINANERPVTCKYCNSEIGGGLDFTNFFSAVLKPKSNPKSSMVAGSISALV